MISADVNLSEYQLNDNDDWQKTRGFDDFEPLPLTTDGLGHDPFDLPSPTC